MPKKLQIELTAEPGKGHEKADAGSQRALVPRTSQAMVAPAVPRASHAKPTRRWRWLVWIGSAAAGVAVALLFYVAPWNAGVVPVALEIVAPGPVTRVLAVNGRIATLRSVAVKSTVAGTLVAPLAREGDVVKQGTVIAKFDDTSQQASVRQAIAALDQGLVAQTQAHDAFTRADKLGGNVSRVTQEDARRAMERADQEVGRLGALVDQAEFQLTKFSIVAPIGGTILTRGVEPGQVVDLSTPLFTLADLGELVVETNVDETYAMQIKTGMPAILRLTGEERTLDGRVSFVAPVVDADTGGLAVKIAFIEPQTAPVGLTVTANIIVDRREAAISAPRSAVVTMGSEHSVFVLTGAKARRAVVTVIDWPADRLVVTEGLKSGDALIVDANRLADGQAVSVTDR